MFARRIVQGKPIARKVGKLGPVGVFERPPSICIIYHGTVDLSGLTIVQSGFNRKHGILHCEAKPSRGQQWVLQLRYGHGKACRMLNVVQSNAKSPQSSDCLPNELLEEKGHLEQSRGTLEHRCYR